MTLPKETLDKINAEADLYGFVIPYDGSNTFYIEDKVKGYQAGATEFAGKAEEQIEAALHKERNAMQAKITGLEIGYLKQIKGLVDALEQLKYYTVNSAKYLTYPNHDALLTIINRGLESYNHKEATNG